MAARASHGAAAEPPLPPWVAPPRAHRRRAAGPPLDRERIVQAGLRVVDTEGVAALSVRRLASELGMSPMSVYWHVRDKAELLDLIGEAVLETIELPPAEGDWRSQLRAVHHAMLGAVTRHPNAVDLMIGRARYGRAGLALFERILTVLREAGLPPKATYEAYFLLYQFLLGFLATAGRSPEFREVQRQGVMYLRTLDPAVFPSIAEVVPVIGATSPAEQFDLGLDVVIEGIASRLVGRPAG